jgi:hypothetical protein
MGRKKYEFKKAIIQYIVYMKYCSEEQARRKKSCMVIVRILMSKFGFNKDKGIVKLIVGVVNCKACHYY